jgi:serine/threonine-protein kinase HipA
MAVKSNNNHYVWSMIQPRHWLAMAKDCQFSPNIMQAIMDNVFDTLERVIGQVTQILPAGFPEHIAEPIFSGMKKIKDRCNKNNQ